MKAAPAETHKKFLEMYDGFSDEIFRFCLAHTRNRDESLDITQETFVKTWDYLRSGKTIDMARAFLYRTARNLIIDRSRKRKAASLDAMMDSEDHPFDPADTDHVPTGHELDVRAMIEELKRLPAHHYEILVMRFIQELTIAEIAKAFKESENTISVRIHRAIKVAQKLFEDRPQQQIL